MNKIAKLATALMGMVGVGAIVWVLLGLSFVSGPQNYDECIAAGKVAGVCEYDFGTDPTKQHSHFGHL